ncbi:hypothetical protein LP420_38240 [Massilia sp. B-10]|nr:hypothetical protein LP420_38240 [Massilia sp. B-10]
MALERNDDRSAGAPVQRADKLALTSSQHADQFAITAKYVCRKPVFARCVPSPQFGNMLVQKNPSRATHRFCLPCNARFALRMITCEYSTRAISFSIRIAASVASIRQSHPHPTPRTSLIAIASI